MRRIEHGHVGKHRVAHRSPDSAEQEGTLQDFLRQWSARGIVTTQQRQSVSCVTGRNSREQVEVVIDNERIDRLTSDVDQSRPGKSEKHQHEEHALFIVVNSRYPQQKVDIDGETWDYDDAPLP